MLSSEATRTHAATSKTIQNTVDVIELLSEKSEFGCTLTEISEELSLPKSTTTRILSNLESRNFIDQDGLKRYRIGMRLFSIGGSAFSQNQIRIVARPYLEELTQRIGESAYLGVLDMDQVLYVDRIESPQPIKSISPIGSHRPVYATAMGKVFLAFMERSEAVSLLDRVYPGVGTPRPILGSDELLHQLDSVRQSNFAIDVGEWDEGLTCLGAPVRARSGEVVAVLGVSGPSWRLNGERYGEISRLLVRAAGNVSTGLGYQIQD